MRTVAAPSTPEEVFAASPVGLQIYERLTDELLGLDLEIRPTRSQITYRRKRGFAFLWDPNRYLASPVPAVLSIALPYQVSSDRVKEVLRNSGRSWLHHIELGGPEDLDAEVLGWVRTAYDAAA